MKTLIVYFSLEGNTDLMAEKIGEKLDADLLRLVTVKKYVDKGFLKIFLGGKSAIMGEKPALEPYDACLQDYDRVIFGFPVWASMITPPIRTFISENRYDLQGKAVSAFCCEAGNGGEKAFEDLSKTLGKDLDETAIFIEPKKHPSEQNDEELERFVQALGE